MHLFKLDRDPNGMGCKLHKKIAVDIKPGLTVLVGCNGLGKTSFLRQIKSILEYAQVPVISFDNVRDGGVHGRSRAMARNDMSFLAQSVCASEGENTYLNLVQWAGDLAHFVRNNRGAKEMWILLDAVDSGTSIDNIVEIKDLMQSIIDTNPNSEVYIVVAANSYEMARDANCFDVYRCVYRTFKSYDAYFNFIMRTRHAKDARSKNDDDDE